MEIQFDELARKPYHSIQEQEKILFNFTLEDAIQEIKSKWANYDSEKKENLLKLLKCCYGDNITNALEEGGLTNPLQHDSKEMSKLSKNSTDYSIEEEKDDQEEEIIIKCSLEEMVKEFFKQYLIIWHDPNMNSPVNQRYLDQLNKFCEIKTFTEWQKAVTGILEAETACHVITSGTNGELLVKEIDSSQNVSKIYVFCKNKDYHSTWAEKYQKVSNIETQIRDLIDQIKSSLLEWYKQAPLKLNLPAFAPIFNNYDKSQMNNLHRFLKILPKFTNRLQAKNDFLMLSQVIFSDERSQRFIKKFEQNYNIYNKNEILQWYTKPSFLFKVTNNCLRIATSDSIQYCRLPLSDLQKAIKEQYHQKSKNFNGLLYRGASISEGEWLLLKDNLKREIEMHGFLSASKDKKIGLEYMRKDSVNGVFITIIVPKGSNQEKQGFVEIKEFSQYPLEEEILFNVRSRFTILETEEEYSKELPCRHLVLLYGTQGFRRYVTEQNPVQEISIEEIDKILCSKCKNVIQKSHSNMLFLSLADLQNRSYCCQKCLPSLLEDSNNPLLCIPMTGVNEKYTTSIKGVVLRYQDLKIPMYGYRCHECQSTKQKFYFKCTECNEAKEKYCCDCLERTKHCLQTKHAIILESSPFSFWCERMPKNEIIHLEIQKKLMKKRSDFPIQGEMYLECHEYQKTIEYNTVYIERNKKIRNQDTKLAIAYNNIGVAYQKQGKYVEALEYYLISLNIRESAPEKNSSDIDYSYNNIASVYKDQGDYAKALEYFSMSLKIRESLHGKNHSSTAISYNNIGSVHDSQRNYSKALEYYLISLEIRELFHGKNHPSTATSYNNIGTVYHNQKNYLKALEYYLMSLEIRESVHGENHPSTANSYNNIASVYKDQENYPKAIEYYLMSLKIQESVHGKNHPSTATFYGNLGSVYKDQGNYLKAFEYYSKTLKIRKTIFGDHHPLTIKVQDRIDQIRLI